jgi:hypothetical protein
MEAIFETLLQFLAEIVFEIIKEVIGEIFTGMIEYVTSIDFSGILNRNFLANVSFSEEIITLDILNQNKETIKQ